MSDKKERPILFSAPMVHALLDGSKTQTRRVFKLPRNHRWDELQGGEPSGSIEANKWPGTWHVAEFAYQHGKPGDRLWVKEAHEYTYTNGTTHCLYKANNVESPVNHPFGEAPCCYKGRPSIFMHRWASRITLEIAGVRVERLQDISEADALAEGVNTWLAALFEDPKITAKDIDAMRGKFGTGPRAVYAALWETINGPGSWAANPWVWVIEFKVIKK